LLLLDARIHYPVHKHPTEPPRQPEDSGTAHTRGRSAHHLGTRNRRKPPTCRNPGHKDPGFTVAAPSGPNSVPRPTPPAQTRGLWCCCLRRFHP